MCLCFSKTDETTFDSKLLFLADHQENSGNEQLGKARGSFWNKNCALLCILRAKALIYNKHNKGRNEAASVPSHVSKQSSRKKYIIILSLSLESSQS